MKRKPSEYDQEPVYYCSRCLSLAIKSDIADICYCDECGSTSISTDNIFEWEEKYQARYGYLYLDKKKH